MLLLLPTAESAPIEIHGAPVDHGGAGPGAAGGPEALRAAGVAMIPGRHVRDRGDVEVAPLPPGTVVERGPDPGSRRPEWPSLRAVCRDLHARTRATVEAGAVPLVLGGDHTLAAGSLSGVLAGWRATRGVDAPLGLVWFDAHVDLNTPGTTMSGNPHGMPLAALLGYGVAPLDDIVTPHGGWRRREDRRRVVMLGGRDLDPGEEARVTRDPDDTTSEHGLLIDGDAFAGGESPESIADRVLKRVAPNGGDAFVLSFDLDVLDPAHAPGVNLRVSNGLDPDTVFRVLERLAAHGGCVAMDVVELDPTADRDGVTARLGVEAVRTMLAR
jgi:arginase